VYLSYGTWDDFESVTSSQDLEGKVALVRSGVISLEQKVCRFLLLIIVICVDMKILINILMNEFHGNSKRF